MPLSLQSVLGCTRKALNALMLALWVCVAYLRSARAQVGLGTDIAGGYSPSMLSSMRNAVIASKALRMQALREHQESGMRGKLDAAAADKDLISWKEALWLATQGGAEALGLQVSAVDDAPAADAHLQQLVPLHSH